MSSGLWQLLDSRTDPIDYTLGYEHVAQALEAYANGTHNGISIKDAFDRNCPTLVADKAFAKELALYAHRFLTKNQDHINFFGGNLIGVYPIRFTIADRNEWFDTVMDTDEVELTNDLHATAFVNPKFHVTGDVFNLCMPYLLHRLHHSTELTPAEIEESKYNVVRIFHYKNLSSILVHDYPYPANKSVALETYKQLSKKFDLKVYGSWKALIDARAKAIVTRGTGIHYDTYVKMIDDKAIVYFVGDVQDRLRDVINSINNVFHAVKKKDNLITDSKNTVELDGVKHIRDVEKSVTKYARYIKNIVGIPSDFIRPELIEIITHSNVPDKPLTDTLKYLSENYVYDKEGVIDAFLDETVQHLFEYIATKNLKLNDYADVISKMRGAYRSSLTKNASVLKLRELGDALVITATGIRTPATIAAVRVGVLLYIVIRTLSMQHYTS